MTFQTIGQKPDSLFRSDEIIKIELRSDFSAIQDDRADNPQYHEGELIYLSPGGESIKLNVRVMARGDFRRDPANCKFPPLAVNFKKNEVKNTLFDNQDKLKLVTPCQFDADVIEEYLVYKMYNEVTPVSLNVRLVKILYFDTGKGKKVFEKYSFFIEDDEHVAARFNAVEFDKMLTPFDLDKESYKKMAVFQYIIGNKDWYITSRRNVVIMKPEDTSLPLFAVPYDFDFAGFVDADYTKPARVPDELLAKRRAYKGLCYTAEEFKEVFEYYKKLRPAFESIIREMTLLSKHDRNLGLIYLEHFYNVIESNELFKQEFLDVCETKKSYNLD